MGEQLEMGCGGHDVEQSSSDRPKKEEKKGGRLQDRSEKGNGSSA